MSEKAKTSMTKADVAKLVRRTVAKKDAKGKAVLDEKNNPVTTEQPIDEKEILSFAEYDDHVVVVTVRGEKLRGAKPKK